MTVLSFLNLAHLCSLSSEDEWLKICNFVRSEMKIALSHDSGKSRLIQNQI